MQTKLRVPIVILLAAAAALTTLLAARTYWYLLHAVTNTPFTDSWLALDEIRRVQDGQAPWTSWWSPHWGQRDIVPRLLFLLSIRFFSFSAAPLILVNAAAPVLALIVLIRAAGRLFPGRPLLLAAVAIAFVHLALSSLGMEILVATQGVVHSIGYAAAISAVVLFERRPWLAISLAALATGSIVIGLLVWPILIVESWRLPVPRKTSALLLALTAAIFALYAIGYTRPPALGMGISGALRHPLEMLRMTSLVLGGPVTLYSLRLGTVAGALGLAALAYLLAVSNRLAFPLLMAACLLAAIAASLVLGRISPEWLAGLHGAQPLPGRYLVPSMIFWGCLLALTLALDHRPWVITVAVSSVVLATTFGTWSWQWRVSREWAVHFQRFDAIGSAFLVDVSDPAFTSLLLTDAPLRDSLVDYMRARRLAMFAEPRARWIGRPVPLAAAACPASLSATPVGNGLRLTGRLDLGSRRTASQLDVLVANPSGDVVGLGRTLPAESEYLPNTEFLAYTRSGGRRLFIQLPDRSLCEAQPAPPGI
jgi:hypothetical protein